MSDRVIRIIIDSRQAQSGADRAKRSLNDISRQAGRTESDLNRLGKTFGVLRTVMYALGTSLVVRELARLSDTAKSLTAQLTLVEESQAKVAQRQRELIDLSLRTGTELEGNIRLYANMKRALQETIGEQGKYVRATESVSKALVLSGADANTAAGVVRQLSQAFGSGVLRGDEFNSVMEGAPRIMRLLADSMGQPIGKLREMAAEGELSSDRLYAALTDRRFTEGLDREFEMLPMTFGRAMENISTAATVAFGEFDRGGRFSNSILEFARFGSQDLEEIGTTAFEVGKDIRQAFGALADAFLPLEKGALAAFLTIEGRADFVSNEIRSLLRLFDDVANLPRRGLLAAGEELASFGDPMMRGLTMGRYSPLKQYQAARARSDAEWSQNTLEAQFMRQLEAQREADAGGLGNRDRGSLRDIRDAAAAIAAEYDKAQISADKLAESEKDAAKAAKSAADEAGRRATALADLKASLADEIASTERQLQLLQAEREGNRDLVELAHELADIEARYAALAGESLDVLKQKTIELARQRRYAEDAQNSARSLDPGPLVDLEKIDLPDPDGYGKTIAKGFRDEGLLAAEALGQAIGGKLGGIVQQLAGLLQGLASGDFTGVRGPLGGILTLIGGGKKDGLKDFAKPITGKLDQIFGGTSGDGTFTAKFGKFAKGFGYGMAASGIAGMLGIKQSKTGAAVGSAVGSAAFGPLGGAIGGFLGGTIGGALKKTKYGKTTVTGTDSDLSAIGNSASRKESALDLGKSVQHGLQSIADQLGGDVGSFNVTIGVRGKDFRVNTSGTSLKKKKGAVDFNQDKEGAIEFASRAVIRGGALSGISDFSQRVLKGDMDLEKAVKLASRYESVLDMLATSQDAVRASAERLFKDFSRLGKQMQSAGATAAELANVEKAYGIEREKALKAALAPLQEYQKSLSGEGSGITALERLKVADATYEKARSDFLAGKIDQSEFTAAGQERFSLARDIYGTATSEFQSIRQQLIADSAQVLDSARSAFESGAPERLQAAVEASNQVQIQSYQQLTQQTQLLQQILAGFGGGGGGNPAGGMSFINGQVAYR